MIVDEFNLSIVRSVEYHDSGSKYLITATASVTANSDPDSVRLDHNVFVKSVEDSSFQRVAGASDLGLLRSSIESARSSSHTEYRDAVLTLEFDDIDTAVAAIPVIRDRVNTSVSNYIEYFKEFKSDSTTLPVNYSLPLPSGTDQEEQLIGNYRGAREAREQADAAVTEAQTSLGAASYKADFLGVLLSTAASANSNLQSSSASHTQAHAALVAGSTGLSAAYNALLAGAAESTSSGGIVTYTLSEALFSQLKNALLLAQDSVVPQSESSRDAVAAAAAALNSVFSQIDTQKLGADSSAASLSASLEAAVAESSALVTLESRALEELSTYCPEVDPNSI
jgi:hypothetical protein